jgi:hypothetical protein
VSLSKNRVQADNKAMFEIVHTLTDYYDGPRRGVADYQEQPHLYESEWQNGENLQADTFLLMPIDADTVALVREHWAIWLRWEAAFHRGETTRETHPALQEDRARHAELARLLQERLVIDPARAVRKRAEFRAREGHEWNKPGFPPFEVQWMD